MHWFWSLGGICNVSFLILRVRTLWRLVIRGCLCVCVLILYGCWCILGSLYSTLKQGLTNRCLLLMAQFYPDLLQLGIGGHALDATGLVPLGKHSMIFYQLFLYFISAMPLTAVQDCVRNIINTIFFSNLHYHSHFCSFQVFCILKVHVLMCCFCLFSAR